MASIAHKQQNFQRDFQNRSQFQYATFDKETEQEKEKNKEKEEVSCQYFSTFDFILAYLFVYPDSYPTLSIFQVTFTFIVDAMDK